MRNAVDIFCKSLHLTAMQKMIPSFCLLSFFAVGAYPLYGFNAIDKQEVKNQIRTIQKKVQEDSSSSLKVDLAIAYYHDQNEEQAFRTYLEALEAVKAKAPAVIHPMEKEAYDQALEIYLSHNSGQGAQETAEKILKGYGKTVEEHPEYYQLNFLTAVSYANLQKFDEFFSRFYRSYQHDPNGYMAYRTKAILHIKLYERARTAEEKQREREAIHRNILQANALNSRDSSLYKLMIAFATSDKRQNVVKDAVGRIVAENIPVPRADVLFYTKAALDVNQKELGQKFLERTREWYKYSQVINRAQKLLDES